MSALTLNFKFASAAQAAATRSPNDSQQHSEGEEEHKPVPYSSTSHPDDRIPHTPTQFSTPEYLSSLHPKLTKIATAQSISSESTGDTNAPSTPATEFVDDDDSAPHSKFDVFTTPSGARKTTENSIEVARLLEGLPEGTQRLRAVCCGGGCCQQKKLPLRASAVDPQNLVQLPTNDAYKSLKFKIGQLSRDDILEDIGDVPTQTAFFHKADPNTVVGKDVKSYKTSVDHTPKYVTPHPPYEVFSSRIHHARALTQRGAEKRTYHFDLDVTDYPTEGGVDFRVGGAIGICAPNPPETIDEIFDILGVPSRVRDQPVTLKTTSGRWPTIWGEDDSRELLVTRRELLTWTVDVQSSPPSKQLLRVLAEYADDADEKKILLFLCSAQGQAAFCDLRTSSHISLVQLLLAFPSSRPPLPHLICHLPYLMPRFYSLSNDPHISCIRMKQTEETQDRRIVEIAVSVHNDYDWRAGSRTGIGSGFLERCALKYIAAEDANVPLRDIDVRIPMFRGLMSNPLAKQFANDGPMLLIGAGVGIAPFRGFVQRRLLSANCANKVWVLQGVRDSLVDELYKGEWGVEEEHVKRVIESRRGTKQYVQDEVRHQADLVWFIINSLDGRIFVCGSSKGMGEGVNSALVDVAMSKGGLALEEAKDFWRKKTESGQYIAETW
jgi:sulfite reductase alpha subunit-like flavoprotein